MEPVRAGQGRLMTTGRAASTSPRWQLQVIPRPWIQGERVVPSAQQRPRLRRPSGAATNLAGDTGRRRPTLTAEKADFGLYGLPDPSLRPPVGANVNTAAIATRRAVVPNRCAHRHGTSQTSLPSGEGPRLIVRRQVLVDNEPRGVHADLAVRLPLGDWHAPIVAEGAHSVAATASDRPDCLNPPELRDASSAVNGQEAVGSHGAGGDSS